MGSLRFGLGALTGIVFNSIPGKSAVSMAATMFLLSAAALVIFLVSRRYYQRDADNKGIYGCNTEN